MSSRKFEKGWFILIKQAQQSVTSPGFWPRFWSANVKPSRTLSPIGKATLFRSSIVPGGPLQGMLTSTAIGGAGGMGLGYLYNLIRGGSEKSRRNRVKRWALLGALMTGLPAAFLGIPRAISGIRRAGPVGLVSYPKSGTMIRTRVREGSIAQDIEKAGSILDRAWRIGDIPVGQSLATVAADPYMSPYQKAMTNYVLLKANENRPRGMIGFGDLLKGAIGAGLGYGVGAILAKTMSGLFGLPAPVRKFVSITGGLAGALQGAGLLRKT